MLQLETEEEIQCAADDLLVFIDDTGHESFSGSQEYYGLGGCAVLSAHYGRLKTLWMDVRTCINGSPDAPLHASNMIRNSDNFRVLPKFFLGRSFVRFAVTAVKTAILPGDAPGHTRDGGASRRYYLARKPNTLRRCDYDRRKLRTGRSSVDAMLWTT